MCSDGWSTPDVEIDGTCEECGEPTTGGEAASGCYYSPVACDKCGSRPCDESC